jgi:hypothetical protein
MGSAVKAGRARVTTSSTAGSLASPTASSAGTTGGAIADQDLVSIDALGHVARVFNFPFPIYGMKTTPNYVIISGRFESTKDAHGTYDVVDSDGRPIRCYLYAVSKKATGLPTDFSCLSTVQVGDYWDPTKAWYSHLGFATRGNKVYFTDYFGGNLYSWTEGTASPVLLYSQAIQPGCPGFDDVFLDPDSDNICVLQTAFSSCPAGYIYCGTDNGLGVTLEGSAGSQWVLAETTQLGKWIVSTSSKIDITSFAVTTRTANGSNGGLPAGASNIAPDANGGYVHIGYAWSLATMDSSGNTCLLSTTNGLSNSGCSITSQTISAYFQSLLGLGPFAWTYGTSDPNDPATGIQLRRIDLTSDAIDPANYLDSTGMASISGLAFAPSGSIQITGKDVSGATVYAFIDPSGSMTTSASGVTALDQVVDL